MSKLDGMLTAVENHNIQDTDLGFLVIALCGIGKTLEEIRDKMPTREESMAGALLAGVNANPAKTRDIEASEVTGAVHALLAELDNEQSDGS